MKAFITRLEYHPGAASVFSFLHGLWWLFQAADVPQSSAPNRAVPRPPAQLHASIIRHKTLGCS